jgi:hypothetical protein
MNFRWYLLGLAVLNAVICIILEDFVMEVLLQKAWKTYVISHFETFSDNFCDPNQFKMSVL